MSAQHTPGPWKYNDKTDVYDSAGATVCELYKGYETRPAPRANAILIAAAPELLEALEELEALGSLELPQRRDAALFKAKAAIAKAKGSAK